MRLSDSSSQYHAMQLFLSKRRGDLKSTVSYTLGRSIDDASGNTDNPEDYLNKAYNRGPSSFDRRHILVTTWTYSVPFFKEGLMSGPLGGWEISGIYRY